jgi:hypothetical protein
MAHRWPGKRGRRGAKILIVTWRNTHDCLRNKGGEKQKELSCDRPVTKKKGLKHGSN